MRKGILVLVVFLLAAGFVFAQDFIVESVSGRVQKESGNSRVNIAVGERLNPDTIVHTGVGASLVLRQGDRTFNIPAANMGKVGELAVNPRARVGGNVATTDTSAVSRSRSQVSTASARASDAAEEDDIAAE